VSPRRPVTVLGGKVALVMGGSRGIGAAIVKRLAVDGASVAFTYMSSANKADQVVRDIETTGQEGLAVCADNGDVDAVRNAVDQTIERMGRLDILVNNAAVNLRGVFVTTQEALRHMGDGGRIIMIGSVGSDHTPFPTASIYALSKGAIAAFTRGLARDLGPRGITVNTVQPGPVATDMNPADGAFAEILRQSTAFGRFGKGEEIASLVSYLTKPEAAFITGASLKTDGGFSA